MTKGFTNSLALIMLLTSSVGCRVDSDPPALATADTLPTETTKAAVNGERSESTVLIRQPWKDGDVIRVRLDLDRLHADALTRDDVIKALLPSGTVDPGEPLPPSGVVFIKVLATPDDYANVILKASADGEIVRLRDVAKVELLIDSEVHDAAPETDHPPSR